MDMPRRLGAEFFGTFWLTFAGCGSAVLAAGFPVSLSQIRSAHIDDAIRLGRGG